MKSDGRAKRSGSFVLAADHYQSLVELGARRSVKAGRMVSCSELIREGIDLLLEREGVAAAS